MEETTSSEQTRAAVDPGDQPLNPDEEIAEIEKLLAAEPDDFQARCRLGELYFSKGRLDDALVEVKKSIEMAEGIRAEMNRSLAMYYSNLGTIYATKNMADEAEAEFKRALDVFQYDVLALFNLGRLCADKKKYMDAKGYYERLVEITPDDPMAWYNLAGVYVELDNPQVSDYNTIDAAIQCYLRRSRCSRRRAEVLCPWRSADRRATRESRIARPVVPRLRPASSKWTAEATPFAAGPLRPQLRLRWHPLHAPTS